MGNAIVTQSLIEEIVNLLALNSSCIQRPELIAEVSVPDSFSLAQPLCKRLLRLESYQIWIRATLACELALTLHLFYSSSKLHMLYLTSLW